MLILERIDTGAAGMMTEVKRRKDGKSGFRGVKE